MVSITDACWRNPMVSSDRNGKLMAAIIRTEAAVASITIRVIAFGLGVIRTR